MAGRARRGRLVFACGLLAAGIAAGALALQAGGAPASHLSCGQVVTSSVTLDSDLNCTGDGLVVGAPGITVDLNGHTIAGDSIDMDVGIDNFGGYDKVTIKNGTITGFRFAVRLFGAVGNRISGLELRSNPGDGILVLADSDDVKIVDNAITGNPGLGINIFSGVNGAKVERNLIAGNGSYGIFSAANESTVSKNTVSRNGVDGILIDGSGHTVAKNFLLGNAADGLFVTSDGNTIKGNVASGNVGDGIQLSGNNNTLDKNTASGNGAAGLYLSDSEDSTIKKTTSLGNAGSGIWVGSGSNGNVLEKSIARGNAQDGLEIDNASTTLTKNEAYTNGDDGIDGTVSPIDGGGNKAKGNVDAQCTVIACA